MMTGKKLNKEDFRDSDHNVQVVEVTDQYLIIDNLLSPKQFEQMWHYFQVESYNRVDTSQYEGRWLHDDGAALRGPTVGFGEKWHAEYPTGAAIDFVMEAIIDNAHHLAPLIGDYKKAWEKFTAFPTLYPRDTGLLWHRDSTDNRGSYTYYGHPEWNIEWGGQLLIADIDPKEIPDDCGTFMKRPQPVVGGPGQGLSWSSHLDNSDANAWLLERGAGYFVAPKPNRLAVIKGGTPHAVAKVTANAGSKVRASVSGFFKKKQIEPHLLKR